MVQLTLLVHREAVLVEGDAEKIGCAGKCVEMTLFHVGARESLLEHS